MQNLPLAATIPFDGYARPIIFSDGALIGLIVLPARPCERCPVQISANTFGYLAVAFAASRQMAFCPNGHVA
jgi:hypothetical protein